MVVHRASFLAELLRPVPRNIMHVDKKLVKIDDAEDGGIILRFKDGSTEHADALLGADGIHGYVRQHILGTGHPALDPVFAGWWDCRNLVPFDKAKKTLGEELFKENRQYGWVGDGGFIMHDVLDDGKTVQCVGAVTTDETWSSKDWKKALSRNKLEDSFATWADGPIAKGMIEVRCMFIEIPSSAIFYSYD